MHFAASQAVRLGETRSSRLWQITSSTHGYERMQRVFEDYGIRRVESDPTGAEHVPARDSDQGSLTSPADDSELDESVNEHGAHPSPRIEAP